MEEKNVLVRDAHHSGGGSLKYCQACPWSSNVWSTTTSDSFSLFSDHSPTMHTSTFNREKYTLCMYMYMDNSMEARHHALCSKRQRMDVHTDTWIYILIHRKLNTGRMHENETEKERIREKERREQGDAGCPRRILSLPVTTQEDQDERSCGSPHRSCSLNSVV